MTSSSMLLAAFLCYNIDYRSAVPCRLYNLMEYTTGPLSALLPSLEPFEAPRQSSLGKILDASIWEQGIY